MSDGLNSKVLFGAKTVVLMPWFFRNIAKCVVSKFLVFIGRVVLIPRWS